MVSRLLQHVSRYRLQHGSDGALNDSLSTFQIDLARVSLDPIERDPRGFESSSASA